MKTFKDMLRTSLKTSLLCLILFVSCNNKPDDGKNPEKPTTKEEVTLTIAYDDNVASVNPKTLKIEKGSKWIDAKKKITITFTQGWTLKGWNVQNKDSTLGDSLQDSYVFSKDTKIFASTKQIKNEVTLTIAHDEHVASVTPSILKVEKGSTWAEAKGKITVTYKDGWTFDAWTLQKEDGKPGVVLKDSYPFNDDTKIFVSSKETLSITLTQPKNGVITIKKINDDHSETVLEGTALNAIPKNTNLKVELKANDPAKHEPTLLKINEKEIKLANNGIIVEYFTIEKNTTIEGIVTAFFKITKTNVENGAITIERNHSGILVPLLDSELVKIPQGKELKITLSGNAGFKAKSLFIKEEKKSASDVITTVESDGKITKTITVNDNITLSGEVIADPNATPLAKVEVDVDGVKFNMINIPALTEPTTLCGQDDVTLDAYQFAQTEVTRALYEKVMGLLPQDQPEFSANVQEADKPLCPVAKITWYNAVAFCNELTIKTTGMSETDCVYYSDEAKQALYRKADGDAKKYPYVDWKKKGFRLPTEAEWEAAALARENKKYPGSDTLETVAWYSDMAFNSELHKVGTKASNAFDLYDMAGNVAEWVWDAYVASNERNKNPIKKNPTYKHQKNSSNSCAGAGTIRGGEYYSAYSTGQYECQGRDENTCKQVFDSVDGFATGIRLSRGGIQVIYEKVDVKKIMLQTYEMRQKEIEKAEGTSGFEKEFFPFTDTIEITVEAEDGASITYSKNPITLTEVAQDITITVTKQERGARTYKLHLKKGGRRDSDATNGEKKTYTVDTAVSVDMISLASVHDVWLGNIDKPNNQPHKVSLSKYQISTTEVTQKLYEAVTGKNPSFFVEKYKVGSDVQELRPVEQVNWYEAVAFCNMLTEKVRGNKNDCVYYDDASFTTVYTMEHAKRDITAVNKQTEPIPQTPYVKWENKGFRLPTEAEWEWASYGGEYGRYAGSNNLVDVAWCGMNKTPILDLPAVTRQVGLKTPNGYGLYDMAGNVYEWCGQWWDGASPNGGQDPKGAQVPKSKHKATRSSSYGLSELNNDRFEDASRRETYNTVFEGHKVCGIRLVCKLF